VPGDKRNLNDHRDYVGPREQYDVIGAAQFALLYALGLRAHHTLLDVGCGSLRAGRLLIAYLEAGRYTGVDPNRWLIDDALEHELGHDLAAIKRPRFDETADFDLAHLGRFDFVLAHGVATNTGPAPLRALLRAIAATLADGGLAAITVIHPDSGDADALAVSLNDPAVAGWRYPDCYAYPPPEIAAAIDAAELTGRAIDWRHPRHRWWLLARTADGLPPEAVLSTLTGATLAL
jgi:SAM-dependent methyltransferase